MLAVLEAQGPANAAGVGLERVGDEVVDRIVGVEIRAQIAEIGGGIALGEKPARASRPGQLAVHEVPAQDGAARRRDALRLRAVIAGGRFELQGSELACSAHRHEGYGGSGDR